MSRIGTCLQCGQRYGDIPDSVTATRVKCRVCGGVVEIPPPAAAAAPAAAPPATASATPAAPSAAAAGTPAAPPPQAKPALEARPAPIAPRPAAAKPAAPVPNKPLFAPKPLAAPVSRPPVAAKPAAPRPAPAPAAKVIPATVKQPAPVVRPAPAPAAQQAPVVRSAPKPAPAPAPAPVARAVQPEPTKPSAAEILAAARAKRSAAPPPPAPKPSAAEILAAAKAKRAGTGVAAAAAKPAAPVRPMARSSERAPREPVHVGRSSSKGPLMLTGVLILVAAGAGGLFYVINQNKPAPPEQKPPVATAPAATGAPAASAPVAEAAAPQQAPAQSSAPPSAPKTEEVGAPPPAADPPPAKAATDANYAWVKPEPGQPLVVPRGTVDPGILKLEEAPPLERWSRTSDETWKSIQEDLALYLENAGARSNRAGDRLVQAGRNAYPALVGAMMKQDYATVEGVKMAGTLNDLVGKIVGGENFGWRSAERNPVGSDKWNEDVCYIKKASMQRYNRWITRLRDNDGEWEAIAKKGGSVGNSRTDEEGKQVGDLPPDLPPDQPPGGR